MEKKDLTNSKLSKNITLEINFKGSEFESFVDLSVLNKKLSAIDKIIKNSVKVLKETRKIKSNKEIIESIEIDLKRNSLDNTILIRFIEPIAYTVIGGLLVNYFSYLAKKRKLNEENEKETLLLNKNINHLNQIINLIQVKEINSVVEIKFEDNKISIGNIENLEIKKTINELKENLDFEEFEEMFLGKIEKVDVSGNKDDYYFTIDQSDKKVPVTFENQPDLIEIKNIIFEKIKITGVARYKSKELIQLHILDYEIIKRISLKDYK